MKYANSRRITEELALSREKGASNGLNAQPLKEYGFDLNKQQFRDGISMRYGWPLSNLHVAGSTISNTV